MTIEDVSIQLPPNFISLSQMQRIRRHFISLNRHHNLSKTRIRSSFLEHLRSSLK